MNKKYLVFIFLIFVASLTSYKVTSTYYENIDNKNLDKLNNEFLLKTEEMDIILNKIKSIEDVVGVEYESDESHFDIAKRFDKVRNKVNLIVQRTKMKDSVPIGKPLNSIHITSKFGVRFHPILKKKKFHKGIDLRAKVGTKVFATAPGVVRFLGKQKKGYGKYIIIQHNYGFETLYGHLDKFLVGNGDIVEKGSVVGYSEIVEEVMDHIYTMKHDSVGNQSLLLLGIKNIVCF